MMKLNEFVKERRREVNLTQPELAQKAGVGLRFMRELEQGKNTLRLDKVNQVLQIFGCQVGAIPLQSNYSFEEAAVPQQRNYARDERSTELDFGSD